MTASVDATRPADRVLDQVRALAPTIAARASEIESARHVPKDLLDQLTGAGCLRLLLPRSHGGLEADLPGAMRVFEELARADASVGWVAMIGATSWVDISQLSRETFDAVYAEGPDFFLSGVVSPMGARSTPVDGGFKVTGRWAFASGCRHARWIYANTLESPANRAMRLVLFTPDQVTIEDTWHVSGLAGTGSHDLVAEDVFLPAERSYLLCDEPGMDLDILRIPVPALLAIEIASVAVGIAQGALDDVIAIAADKVPLLDRSKLSGNPLFQHRLGTAEVTLRAARSLIHVEAAAAMAAAAAREQFTPEMRARLRSAATFAATAAAEVVDTAYSAAGGSAVYLRHPLQRRLRDIHALTQHFLIKPDTLTASGAVLAGGKPGLALF